MCPAVQACLDGSFLTLMVIVSATASSSEPRVAPSEAPTVTSSRNRLGFRLVAVTPAGCRLLSTALVGIILAAVQVLGTVCITVAHPVLQLLRLAGATLAGTGGVAFGPLDPHIPVIIGKVAHVIGAVVRPDPAVGACNIAFIDLKEILGTVCVLVTEMCAVVFSSHLPFPNLSVVTVCGVASQLDFMVVVTWVTRSICIILHILPPPPVELGMARVLVGGKAAGLANIGHIERWPHG